MPLISCMITACGVCISQRSRSQCYVEAGSVLCGWPVIVYLIAICVKQNALGGCKACRGYCSSRFDWLLQCLLPFVYTVSDRMYLVGRIVFLLQLQPLAIMLLIILDV